MSMKKFATILLLNLAILNPIISQTMYKSYLDYIMAYADLAVEQQKLHKIPASIKLAQGLLESAAGKGELVQSSNNHFGIKCSNWNGEKVYADDDTKDECFRKYKSARESYEDHSQFLLTRDRYRALFKLDPTDYKGWALGLKEAGYASDANYAYKLIKIIEDYDLHKFDLGKAPEWEKVTSSSNKKNYNWSHLFDTKEQSQHQLYKNNGVKCVFAESGDTYASIAKEFKLNESKILSYNDLMQSVPLEPGTIVYIGAKKNKASKEFKFHKVSEGESLYRISQKYAIKLQKLYDMNQIPYDEGAVINQNLRLR